MRYSISSREPRAAPRSDLGSWRLFASVCAVVSVGIAVGVWRWQQMGTMPTGIDPGNWLAFGKDLVGAPGKSTPGAYPPLVPFATHLLAAVSSPLDAVKVLGIGSVVAVFVAVSLVVGNLTRQLLPALAAGGLSSMATGIIEPLAFGGYPQNYALSFGLVALWLSALTLRPNRPWYLPLLAALAFAATATSHHMYFYVFNASAIVMLLIWLSSKPPSRQLRRGVLDGLLIALSGWLAYAPTLYLLVRAGYTPPLNPSPHLEDSFFYALGDAAWLWAGIIVGSIAFLAFSFRRRHEAWWLLAVAVLAPSLIAFFLTAEPRLMAAVTTGSALTLAVAVASICDPQSAHLRTSAALSALLCATLLLIPVSHRESADLFAFYRVMTPDLEEAAFWIDEQVPPRSVAVLSDHHGWPFGWWLEGLTSARILVGSNLQWLAFPEEMRQAKIANGLTAQPLSADEATRYARDHDIDFVLTGKTTWIGWRSWISDPSGSIRPVFENGSYVILEMSP
jgi:hypothetical protein